MRNSRLLHHPIGGVTRQDFPIDRKIAFCDRTEPDFVIAFALPNRLAAVFAQQAFYIRRE